MLVCAVYVDIGDKPGDTATLAFAFGAGTTGNRLWEIKVIQLYCDAILK